MKTRKFISTMMVCLVLLLVFAVGLVACDPNNNTPQTSADTYYLSLKSTGFETYANAEEIPAGVLLENKDGKYSVSIALKKDEEFTVNKLGGNEKLGYSAIFSSAHQLAEGSDGNIKVTVDGAYDITLAEGAIAYSFTPYVASVQIAAPASVLELGQEYQFAATVKMTDDSETDGVSWSTSNAQVASVSESGLVTALAVGNATIKATSTADTSKFAEYAVQVIQGKVDVQSVTVSPEEVLLDEGETAKLTEQILPDNATDKLVIWESDNLDVATVDGGTVTAISPGIAHITVRTRDGGKEATATVTVRQPVLYMDTYSEVQVVLNGAPRIIRPLLLPTEATNKKIRAYISSPSSSSADLEIELVGNDTAVSIKGTKSGTVILAIESVDNPEVIRNIRVQVRDEGTKLAWLSEEKFNVGTGETHELEVFSDNAEIESVSWTAADSNSRVEGHSENGKFTATVTGVSMGKSQVTATVKYKEGGQSSQTATVYVTEDFYFIYGTRLDDMGDDWDFETYISDKNKARKDGRLLEQESVNTYVLERRLTPEMGFQIIFPSVTSDWESAIKYPSVYYNAAKSDNKYVSNTQDQFRVNMSGIYQISLTINDSIMVSIKLVRLDVDAVELSVGESQRSILREGERTVIQSKVIPDEGVDLTADEFKWSVSVDVDDAKIEDELITIPSLGAEVEYYLNAAKTSMTVNVIKAESGFEINFTLELRGIMGYVTIPVMGKNDVVVPVSEIAFEQDEYLINVNNGGAAWATKVKATVNDDATMQGVVYSVSGNGARVDRVTGDFTARNFGVYTVTATALGDATKTATTQVKVFSDSFYLSGAIAGKIGWGDPEVLPQVATSLEGTEFEQFKFNDTGDHVHFSLKTKLSMGDAFQIVFLGMDDSWTCVLTKVNLDLEDSPSAHYNSAPKDIIMNQGGEFELIIDISRATDNGSTPVVSVHCLRKYPADFTLSRVGDQKTLKKGDVFRLTLDVSGYDRYFRDFEFYAEEGYEDYLDIVYDPLKMSATCTVKDTPQSGLASFSVFVKLYDMVRSVLVTIIADGEEVVLPSEITFEQEHYYYNVNNGGKAWEQQVIATIDDKATDDRVGYTIVSGSYASVDPNTGIVTSQKLGTFTVRATALANHEVTAETLVTFYSDTLYLIGEIGDLQTYTTLPPSTTSIVGTGVYERYAFTMVDRTHFYLERTLEKMKLKAGNVDQYEYGFQIAFLGVDTMSVGVIKLPGYNAAGSYQAETYLAPRDQSMRVNVTGVYRIDVSLEGATPYFTVNYRGLAEQEVKMTADDVLFNDGDSVDISLQVKPDWIEPEENKFSYQIVDAESGADLSEYVGLSFDFAAKKLTATVKKVPLTGDLSATVRVTYGEASGELAVTIVGTHHMAMTSDDDYHWMQCVDCDYTEGAKTAHTRSSAKYFDNMTHYYLCSACGRKFDEATHFTLDAEGYHDGTHTTCDECGFKLYEINNNGVITKYNGAYGKLKIPTEVNGRQVTGLYENLFYQKSFIEDVQLCPTLTYIGNRVFAGTSIPEVTVKANITYGEAVYTGLGSIRSYLKVNIEDGVTEIPDSMFNSAYIEIDFSNLHNLTRICSRAFGDAYFANNAVLKLPEGLETIEANAFYQAHDICDLIIPDSCTSIGKDSLSGLWDLKRITFGKGMTDFSNMESAVGSTVCEIIFLAENITYMDNTLFGPSLNCRGSSRSGIGSIHDDAITALYFNMSVEDLKNMPFSRLQLPFASDKFYNSIGGDYFLNNRNGFLYDPMTRAKRMYYYSAVRPAEDADEWEFAGAWHFDKDGNVQKWSDTPLEEG